MPTTTTWLTLDSGTSPKGLFYTTVTIADGASLSGAINLHNMTLVSLQIPASWTSAKISFAASLDDTTFGSLLTPTGEIASTAALADGNVLALDPSAFFGQQYLKVRSGTAAAATNQTGAKIIRVVARSMQ